MRRYRLTESRLRNMIREAVKSVLIDGQEDMYSVIANLEHDLETIIRNTDNSSGQAFGSIQDKLLAISNTLSHVDPNLSQQAKSTFEKLMEVKSELQDLRIQLKTIGAKDSYWGHDFKTPGGTVDLSNYR